MGRIKEVAIFIGLTLMAVAGCSRSYIKPIKIDSHVFNVPEEYLIQGSIPWLSEHQHDGLMFHINPDAPLPDRVSVLIQSTAITCRPDEPIGASPLAVACRVAAHKEIAKSGVELEKVHPNDDPTQWEYRVKGQPGKAQRTVVATCSAMGDGNGLCRSFSNYSDLVYTIGLRDSEVVRLPEIRKKIHQLLSSWEELSRDGAPPE